MTRTAMTPAKFLLAACVIAAFALIPAGSAMATVPDFNYSSDGSQITISGCDGDCPDALEFPATIDGLPITEIAPSAFEGSALTSVTLPSSLLRIGGYAFKTSGLTSIDIPEGVVIIGYGAFEDNTSLTTATLPSTLTDIGSFAFNNNSSLANVNFNGNAPNVGQSAFSGVASGATATVAHLSLTGFGNERDDFNGLTVKYNLDVTYTNAGDHIVITGCVGGAVACPESLVIPDTIEGLPVTEIGDSAFVRSPIRSVTLPSTLTKIGSSSFEEASNLVSVVIPEGVTSIGADSFHLATSLTTVVLPSTLQEISAESFYEDHALTDITLPAGLTTLGDGAFANTGSLTTITIPDGVTTIGSWAFADSGITSITLSINLTLINDGAFWGTTGLTSITLPASLTTIGNEAFRNSTNLANFNFLGNAPTVGLEAFTSVASGAKASLASSSLTGFGSDGDDFYGLTVSFPAPLTYTNAGDHIVITGCEGGVASCPDALVIPDTIEGLPVTDIQDSAFYRASFSSVTLPSTLTRIGWSSFEEATNLTSIVIPEGVTLIGGDSFHKATSLKSVTLPSTLEYIGGESFYEDQALTDITLPDGLTTLGDGAFANTASLTSLTIPDGITSIAAYTFAGSGISSITLPSTLTTISEGAFTGAPNLTAITFPASLTSIGHNAFRFANSLANVYFQGDAPAYGNNVFTPVALGARAHLASSSLTGFGNDGDSWLGLTVTYPLSVTYFNTGTSILITGCVGGAAACPANLVIPATIEGLPVTGIAGEAFYASGTLSSVTLPDSVTEIGNFAFYFTPLKTIKMSASLTSIGKAAFSYTSLVRIAIPSGVTDIGQQAFAPSSLKYVTFEGNAPANVTEGAFDSGATGGQAILASSDLTGFGNAGDVWNYLTVTYPTFKYTVANDEVTITGYNGDVPATLTIPDSIEDLPVKSIGANAFAGETNLEAVTIPNTVTSIGAGAFDGASSLATVNFQGDAPSVGADAFNGVASGAIANLASDTLTGYGSKGDDFHGLVVTPPVFTYQDWGGRAAITGCVGGAGSCPDPLVVPDSIGGLPVTDIADSAFFSASFTSITLPSTLKSIGGSSFEQASSLKSIDIPEGVTFIGQDAFHKAASLTTVNLPSTLKYIQGEAFYECRQLTGITLPAGLEQLGPGAFATTPSITGSVTIPNGISYIGDWTFAGSGITSLTLSNTLSFIGTGAFASIKVTSLTIPASVTYMGSDAFNGASNLADVNFQGDAPGLGARVFKNVAAGARANLATASLSGYGYNGDLFGGLVVTGGLDLPFTYTVADNTATVTGCAASPCPATLEIPATVAGSPVTKIGNAAFQGAALTSITLPSSVTSIGDDAFSGATGLVSVTFQGAAPTLGANAFASVAAGAKAKLSVSNLTGYGYNGELFGGLVISGGQDKGGPVDGGDGGGSGGTSVVTKIKFGGRSGNLTVPAGRSSVPIAFTSSQIGTFTLKVLRGSRVYKIQTGSIKLGANKILLLTKRLAARKYRVVLTLTTTPPPGRRARGAVPTTTKTTVTRYLTVKRAAFTG